MIFKLQYATEGALSERTDINGKYVWLIDMTTDSQKHYVVYPLEKLEVSDYIKLVFENEIPEGYDSSLNFNAEVFDIDTETTNAINDTYKYIEFNSIIPSSGEPSIDDMKNFRTIVANMLHAVYKESTDSQLLAMLDYYSSGMNDDAVRLISEFRNTTAQLAPTGAFVDCGCATKPMALTLGTVSVCDALQSYRDSVHDYMVSQFSEAKFWEAVPHREMTYIIDMLKGIVNANFPINAASDMFGYGDCSCLTYGTIQESAMKILNNLVSSFEYIRDGEWENHKNFVYSTLSSWSRSIYEHMQW